MKEPLSIKGDVTNPIGSGNRIIIHCCNDIFVMGSGVALALLTKWPVVREKYIEWGVRDNPHLGDVQFIKVEDGLAVGNMIGQHGIRTRNSLDQSPPIRYEAIDECLKKVATTAKKHGASVHLPMNLGSGLAGGKWTKIEELIRKNLCEQDIEVTIYEFQG